MSSAMCRNVLSWRLAAHGVRGARSMGCMSARHRLVVCLSRRVSISLNTLNVEGNLLILLLRFQDC